MPARPIAIALFIATIALLLLQPDVGQTLLLTAVWGGMFFVSGTVAAGCDRHAGG